MQVASTSCCWTVLALVIWATGPFITVGFGADWHVDRTTSEGNGSLRWAVNSAENGDTIIFDTAVSGDTITLNQKLDLENKGLTFTNGGTSTVTINTTDYEMVFGSGTSSLGKDITFKAELLTPVPDVIGVCCFSGDDIHLSNLSSNAYTNTLGLSYGFWGGSVTIDNFNGTMYSQSSSGWALPFYADSLDVANYSGTVTAICAKNYASGAYIGNDITIGDFSGSITTSAGTSGSDGLCSVGGNISINGTYSGTISALSTGTTTGLWSSGDIYINEITKDGVISASGSSTVYGLYADAGTSTAANITLGTSNGLINADATAGTANGLFCTGSVSVGNQGGTVSATVVSGSGSFASGIYATGNVEITSLGTGSLISGSAPTGAADGIYTKGDVSIKTLNGTLSASSQRDACAIDSTNVRIDTWNGLIQATSGSESALGLWTNAVTVGSFNGKMTVQGAAQSYGVNANSFEVTDQFTGSISATSTDAAVLGLLTTGDISIHNFSGMVSAHGYGDTYTIGPFNGNLQISGSCSGSILANSDAGDAFGIYTPMYSTVAIENLSGTIRANGAGNAVGITTQTGGTVALTGLTSGSIQANAASGYAVGIWSGSKVVIPKLDTTGVISATGVNEAYGILTNGDVEMGECAGTVSAKAVTGPAFGIYAPRGLSGSTIAGGTDTTPTVISGSVVGSGTSAYAIYGEGINVQVANGATVSATKTATTGEAYAICTAGTSSNQVELVSGCRVSGDIYLNSAAKDHLLLSGSTGCTTLSGGITADEIDVVSGNWRLCGAVSSTANLEILGGSLSYCCPGEMACNINVNNSGTVSFNGSTTGTATVNPGCVFMGTGTVGELINLGKVAPGNSIGAINVTGKYTQVPTSVLEIEISPSGQSDRLDITGNADIQGGTVNVVGSSGKYRLGTTYRFLTAAGSVTGTFDELTDNLPFLDMTLVYGATYIDLLLRSGGSYDSEAITFNQHGVARYLDAQKSGATGDFAAVLDELNTLNAPEARAAFDAMSGEIFGSLSTIGIENHERFLRTIAQRLQSQSMSQGVAEAGDFGNCSRTGDLVFVSRNTSYRPSLSGWTTWAEGYGVGGAIAGNGNASGLDYSTGGVAVGMERQLTDCFRAGCAGGYSSSYTTLDARRDTASIDGGQLALYVHHDIECFYLTGIADYGYNGYSADRQIIFAELNRSPHATYGGNNFGFYTEAGRTICGRYLHWQPYAALEYIQLHQNDFAESGANSIDIVTQGTQADAFRGLLGARILANLVTNSGLPVTWESRAAWRHEFLNETSLIDASFADQTGGAFAIAGINVDRDNAILGTSLTLQIRSNFSVFAGYDVVTSQNYTAHAGSGGLQYLW
jgi:uncharacterized protein with beta-barrel porin domain